MKFKANLNHLLLIGLGITSQAGAQIVYQDNFDGDGVDVNTSTGGGGAALLFNGAGGTNWGWDDDGLIAGALTAGTAASGNRITTFNSNSVFYITDGFTLEVSFDLTNIGGTPFPSNNLSFGLAAQPASASDSGFIHSLGNTSTYDTLGFSLGERDSAIVMGILEDDFEGTGVTTLLSGFDFTTGTNQTVTLTVASDGSYTYSYIDASATEVTGSGTTNIDMSQPYYFKARTQGSSDNAIHGVTLTTSTSQFTAPTIVASEGLLVTGESVDLDITFDISSDTVVLTTPTGTVDLIALDSSDTTPNDGIVSVTDTPTSTFTYEVEATRSDISPQSASTQVLVADTAGEAPDNAFSLAVKADSPLFYYRFEEATDSTFLLDSSGNGYHTDAITGTLTLGSGPGGMQNAARADGNAAVTVPAVSTMNEDFTFMTVVNVDDFTSNTLRNLLSMSDGTATGRSILYYGNGGFQTFIAGSASIIADENAITSEDSCLVHMVFDADLDEDPGTVDPTISIYVNGALYGSPVTLGAVAANESNWVLFSNKNLGTQGLIGWADETAVFEEVLPEASIEAHAASFFEAGDPLLGFSADSSEVESGSSVTLTWKVSDSATLVTLDGVSVDGAAAGGIYSVTLTPTQETTYTLVVEGPDGPFTREVTVGVTAPPGPPQIISITVESTEDPEEPEVTLVMTGSANTTYRVMASNIISDDFQVLVREFQTGDSNTETITFNGFGLAEFYLIEEVAQ